MPHNNKEYYLTVECPRLSNDLFRLNERHRHTGSRLHGNGQLLRKILELAGMFAAPWLAPHAQWECAKEAKRIGCSNDLLYSTSM